MTNSKFSDNAFATPVTEAAQKWESHTATFTVHWGRAGAVLAASGEIDAVNSGPFADYVKRCADCCEWLVLDLSPLAFIGTVGFSALQSISAQCTRSRIQLMVIPGRALSAVLRVCDPDSGIPLAASLTEALADVQNSGRLLHAVR